MTLNIGYALSSMILINPFFVSLVAQLKSKKYHPLLYWTVILSTSTAGSSAILGSILVILILYTSFNEKNA